MPKRHKIPMRCVNCGINMFYAVACTELSPYALSILQEWIPGHDFKESTLCYECCGLLRGLEGGEGRAEGEGGAPRPARLLGHSLVCRGCGRSLHNRRKAHRPVCDANKPHLYEHLTMVCAACLRRTERAANNPDTCDDNTEEPEENETKIERKTAEASYLTLSNYRRARGVGATCAAAGCGARGARVALTYRRRTLRDSRLYLPTDTRLCSTHRPAPDLTPLLHLSSKFTGEQIADMLFLMKPFPPPLNADDVESMDRCLRRIWLGVTWEEFLATSRANPTISQRALAIRLCAQNSGECAEVLASLFQLPREEIDQALSATQRVEYGIESATKRDSDEKMATTIQEE